MSTEHEDEEIFEYYCRECGNGSDERESPCPHCGNTPFMPPDYTPKTDEEIADAVLDRLRGGPKARLRAFATEVELSYEELLDRMQQFIECDGNDVTIHLGFDTPDYDHGLLWDAYELVTGTKVPSDIRAGYMVGCAC